MIHFMRTAAIAPGKLGDAMAFAREVAKVVKSVNGVELALLTPIGGNPNRICWFSTYRDLGDFSDTRKKLGGSPEYMSLIAKAAPLFIAGSLYDDLWESFE